MGGLLKGWSFKGWSFKWFFQWGGLSSGKSLKGVIFEGGDL